jgi:hypothetical protein
LGTLVAAIALMQQHMAPALVTVVLQQVILAAAEHQAMHPRKDLEVPAVLELQFLDTRIRMLHHRWLLDRQQLQSLVDTEYTNLPPVVA